MSRSKVIITASLLFLGIGGAIATRANSLQSFPIQDSEGNCTTTTTPPPSNCKPPTTANLCTVAGIGTYQADAECSAPLYFQ